MNRRSFLRWFGIAPVAVAGAGKASLTRASADVPARQSLGKTAFERLPIRIDVGEVPIVHWTKLSDPS